MIERQQVRICKEIRSIMQFPHEPTYQYLERFYNLLQSNPNHGFEEFACIVYFLEGLNPQERETLDIMAGGSILDCHPDDIWSLIEKRAAGSKVYAEIKSILLSLEESDMRYRENMQRKNVMWTTRNSSFMSVETRDDEESPPKSMPHSLDDTQDIIPSNTPTDREEDEEEEEEEEKNVHDESSLAVPTNIIVNLNVQPEDFISPQCLAITTKQSTVSIGSSDLVHTSNSLLSFHMQNSQRLLPSQTMMNPNVITLRSGKIVEGAGKVTENQNLKSESEEHAEAKDLYHADAMNFFKNTLPSASKNSKPSAFSSGDENLILNFNPLPFPMQVLKAPKHIMINKELCDLFSKVEDEVTRINIYKVRQRPPEDVESYGRPLYRVGINWKSRKKSKQMLFGGKFSTFFGLKRKRHSSLGWKPGWNSWKSISKPQMQIRLGLRKFDQTHPWAPNI